ncbi:MAG: tetratricopeptide repeat protein [Proteobacteria bacterium]|nr:tetratricopeptide repeat protein [Pseudomonadota bacterium]
MAEENVTRKLTAILYADVAGYSRLTGEDEVSTHKQLSAGLDLISQRVEGSGGRVVHYAGDAVLADFGSVVAAVDCAVRIQRQLAENNAELPDDKRLQFRIGVNLGEVIVDRDDIYGDGVNVAARLESLADVGGVCVSASVFDQVKGKLDVGFQDMGAQEVKNIAEPVRAYRVALDGAIKNLAADAKNKGWQRRQRAAVAAGLGLVAIAGFATWWQFVPMDVEPASVERMALPLPDKPSIAVLPFVNMSGDPEQEYFADGMTEDLITDLSKISGLFVIARSSTFTYKGRSVKVREVAEELGVRYVLEGSVRLAGDQVRINAQLIDATTGGHLWADRYDGSLANIFPLQDKVTEKIVAALALNLTDSEQAQLRRKPTDNLEAYDYYLRAKQGTYGYDGEGLADALSLYEKAVALDPKFADAYAGYARVAVDVWRLDVDSVLPGPVARKRAYEAAAQALALDANNPGAYSVLGMLQMVDSRYDEAITSVKKAVSLDPNNAEAYINLALVLTHSGRPTEAVAAMETALRLNPRPPPGVNLLSGFILFMDRQYERATEQLEKAREAMPTNAAVHEQLAMAYAQLGRLDEARAEVNEMLKKRPWVNLAYLRLFYAYHKRPEDLDHRIEALRKAGMPKWPFGYEGRAEDRLDTDAIKAVAFGRTWKGYGGDGVPFVKQISEDGTVSYRDPSHYLSGFASVERGMICQKYAAFLMGRKYCSHLYRNPNGTPEERNEYIIVSVFRIAYFSVAK